MNEVKSVLMRNELLATLQQANALFTQRLKKKPVSIMPCYCCCYQYCSHDTRSSVVTGFSMKFAIRLLDLAATPVIGSANMLESKPISAVAGSIPPRSHFGVVHTQVFC